MDNVARVSARSALPPDTLHLAMAIKRTIGGARHLDSACLILAHKFLHDERFTAVNTEREAEVLTALSFRFPLRTRWDRVREYVGDAWERVGPLARTLLHTSEFLYENDDEAVDSVCTALRTKLRKRSRPLTTP